MTEWAWGIDVVATAVFGGFLASYCVVLGRYFDYLLRSGQTEGFTRYYRGFRDSSGARWVYGACMVGQMAMAVVALVVAWGEEGAVGRWAATACMPIMMGSRALVGFGPAEERINSGADACPEDTRTYLRWNLPLHMFWTCLYLAAAILLVLRV